METAARLARAGYRVISFVALLLIALMFVYGAYSLWDTWAVYRGAVVSSDLLQFKPSADSAGEGNPTLAELQAVNPDVRAWLTVDGTHIDYPVVQGFVAWMALIFVVVNLLADLLYRVADPRIRLREARPAAREEAERLGPAQ